MTNEKLISKMTGLLKSVITWGMRMLLAGVTGMNMIENMMAPSLDNLKKMSVTKTISMIPGLGNTAEAVGNVFLGSAVVIKNGVGAAALIGVIFICVGPILKMMVFTLLYKLAGAVVQPFADKRICGCIDCVGEGASLLLRALVTGMLMFLITIAVVVTATR
jgi:stage III sporulation protein AE